MAAIPRCRSCCTSCTGIITDHSCCCCSVCTINLKLFSNSCRYPLHHHPQHHCTDTVLCHNILQPSGRQAWGLHPRRANMPPMGMPGPTCCCGCQLHRAGGIPYYRMPSKGHKHQPSVTEYRMNRKLQQACSWIVSLKARGINRSKGLQTLHKRCYLI